MLVESENSISMSGSDSDGDAAGDGRRQYTLKGVENEAIDLMRQAAQAQGMKIGHWVSERLKEAARKALDDADRQRAVLEAIAKTGSVSTAEECVPAGELRERELHARVASLELEIHELVRMQRDILGIVLAKVA